MTDASSNSVILNIEEKENNNNNIIVKDGKLSQSFEIEMNIIDKEVSKKYSEIMEKNKCSPNQCNNEYYAIPYECISILCFFIFLIILVILRANKVF